MSQHFITGLDIGTNTIKGVVGTAHKNGTPRILKAFRYPSAGMRKGMIVDMDDAVGAFGKAVDSVRLVARGALKRVFVNLGSPKVEVKSSKGFVVVSRGDDVISEDDVNRVIQASQAINLPSNRDIVHVMPREFIVDGVGDIRDPAGLSGARLEVESFVIHAFSPVIKNIHRCAELSDFKIYGLIFGPLAVAKSVLSKKQLDLGVVCVDMGASTTSMSVYEEGQLVYAKLFPVGAANITNDIAIGLKVPIEVAERVKLSYGCARVKEIHRKDSIELGKVDASLEGIVSRRFVSEIIEVRLAEILEFIVTELKDIGRYGQLPGGVVATGGGAKMPGMADALKQELRLPAQIGVPLSLGSGAHAKELKDYFEDPEMALASGLFLWGMEDAEKKSTGFGVAKGGRGMLKFLKQFLP